MHLYLVHSYSHKIHIINYNAQWETLQNCNRWFYKTHAYKKFWNKPSLNNFKNQYILPGLSRTGLKDHSPSNLQSLWKKIAVYPPTVWQLVAVARWNCLQRGCCTKNVLVVTPWSPVTSMEDINLSVNTQQQHADHWSNSMKCGTNQITRLISTFLNFFKSQYSSESNC